MNKVGTAIGHLGQMFDRLLAFGRVETSALSDRTNAILYDVASVGFSDDPDDAETATRDRQEAYGALGVLARPRKAETNSKGEDLFLEALGATASDGLIPFAFRDSRINEWVNKGGGSSPKEGQVMLAGYGGSFLSFETIDESGGPTNIAVLYVPFDRDGDGIPQKAHTLMLDPTAGNESIAVVHASGFAMTMSDDAGLCLRGDSGTVLQLKPGAIMMTATNISLIGNVAIGKGTGVAAAYIGGSTAAPCSSLFLYP
jgi:hypothetical protein